MLSMVLLHGIKVWVTTAIKSTIEDTFLRFQIRNLGRYLGVRLILEYLECSFQSL